MVATLGKKDHRDAVTAAQLALLASQKGCGAVKYPRNAG